MTLQEAAEQAWEGSGEWVGGGSVCSLGFAGGGRCMLGEDMLGVFMFCMSFWPVGAAAK
jgi:hypothetical protein